MLTPFPGHGRLREMGDSDGGRRPTVDGIPLTRHWLIPQEQRPEGLHAASDDVAEEIRRGTQGVWDRFYSCRRSGSGRTCVESLQVAAGVRADFEAVPADVHQYRHRHRQRACREIGSARPMACKGRTADCSSPRRCRIWPIRQLQARYPHERFRCRSSRRFRGSHGPRALSCRPADGRPVHRSRLYADASQGGPEGPPYISDSRIRSTCRRRDATLPCPADDGTPVTAHRGVWKPPAADARDGSTCRRSSLRRRDCSIR